MAQPQPGPTQDPLRALEEKITELLGGLREKTSQAQEQTLRHLELYSEGLDELKVVMEGGVTRRVAMPWHAAAGCGEASCDSVPQAAPTTNQGPPSRLDCTWVGASLGAARGDLPVCPRPGPRQGLVWKS